MRIHFKYGSALWSLCLSHFVSLHSGENIATTLFPYQLVHSHHGQVGTAGLDLVLYVCHLPDALHTAFLGVAEVTGCINMLVQFMKPVNAQG